MNKMRNMEFNGYFTVLIFWGVMILGKAEIYIVTLEGEHVVSYRGGVDGFEATAVDSDSDDKIDVTRFETWYQIGLDHQGRWVLPSSKMTRLHKEKDLLLESLSVFSTWIWSSTLSESPTAAC